MNLLRRPPISLLAATIIASATSPSNAELINFRSGNGNIGEVDSVITMYPKGYYAVGPFSPADFAAADTGAPATIVPHTSYWISGLSADPDAQWIAVNPPLSPLSTLYAYRFTVTSDKIKSASIQMAYAADDEMGEPGVAGLYLNGQPIEGSNAPAGDNEHRQENTFSASDIAALLKPGENVLYFYQHDVHSGQAGAIFSGTINIETAVDILIRPYSPTAPVYNQQRYIPVAILGSAHFDVTQVDRTSVRFGPNAAKSLLLAPAPHGLIGDYNGDGIPDLALLFSIDQTGIRGGDGTATLTGQTVTGDKFSGTGSYVLP